MSINISSILRKLIVEKSTPHSLALAFSVGTFIAISPIIPLQTPIAIIMGLLLGLNKTVIIAALYIVNNPITMIPIYVFDYLFGVWFFERLLGIPLIQYNPIWVDDFFNYISRYINLKKYLGTQAISFWTLILGGIIFAAIIALITYPIMWYIFKRLIEQIKKNKPYENNNSK